MPDPGLSQFEASGSEAASVERAARVWWETLRGRVGVGVHWEEADEESKEETRRYIRSTHHA